MISFQACDPRTARASGSKRRWRKERSKCGRSYSIELQGKHQESCVFCGASLGSHITQPCRALRLGLSRSLIAQLPASAKSAESRSYPLASILSPRYSADAIQRPLVFKQSVTFQKLPADADRLLCRPCERRPIREFGHSWCLRFAVRWLTSGWSGSPAFGGLGTGVL